MAHPPTGACGSYAKYRLRLSPKALYALSAERVPDCVNPSDVIFQRIGIADNHTIRAVDALTATGAWLPLLRSTLTNAAAAVAIFPVPATSRFHDPVPAGASDVLRRCVEQRD